MTMMTTEKLLFFKSGVIDGAVRDKQLINEDVVKEHIRNGEYCKAFLVCEQITWYKSTSAALLTNAISGR